MISPSQPLGPYFYADGTTGPGLLAFLDPSTDVPKTIYADQALTIPAANPAVLGSDGKTAFQYWYGVGDYKVRQYEGTVLAPANLVREWIDAGLDSPSVPTATIKVVDTIADLADVDPLVDGIICEVIGYYTAEDDIPVRFYRWDAASTAPADGGAVIGSTLYGTGRWILKADGAEADVRWWGGLPDTSNDCNSAISACLSYAYNASNGEPGTAYFPAGAYTVTPGTIAAPTPVRMDRGVSFACRIAGTFTLRLSGRFNILMDDAFENVGSVGTAFLDLSTGPGIDTADVAWWGEIDVAWAFVGSCPLMVRSAENSVATGGDYEISKLIVRGGSVAFNDTAHKITIVELDAPQGTQVITGSSASNPCVAFGGTVYSSTVSADIIRWADGSLATLVMDADRGMGAFDSVPLWGLIQGAGGRLITSAGYTTEVTNVTGKVFECLGTVIGCSNVDNFYLASSGQVEGFIRSGMYNTDNADFQGEEIALEIDLSEYEGTNVSISNLVLTGDMVIGNGGTTTVTLKGCKIYGDVTTNVSSVFNLSGCVWQPTTDGLIVAQMIAESCTITPNGDLNPATLCRLTDCVTTLEGNATLESPSVFILGGSVSGGSGSKVYGSAVGFYEGVRFSTVTIDCTGDYNIQVSGCLFANAFIVFSGSGTMDKIRITGNDFVNSAALGLYEPINIDSMTVTGLTPCDCYVGGNTPTTNVATSYASGTRVRQTHCRVSTQATGAPFFASLETADQNWAFAPYTVDSTPFKYVSMSTVGGVTPTVPLAMSTSGGKVGIGSATAPVAPNYLFMEIEIYRS